MARAKSQKDEAGNGVREQILAAAKAEFARLGLRGASVRGIAAGAGVTPAMINYHFGGKEGLYHAALSAQYERLLELELPEADEADPEARIRAVMSTIWRFCRQRPDAVRLLLRHVVEHGSLPDGVREAWAHRVLERAIEVQAALGLPSLAEHRLALLSLNHLIARYVISPTADLQPFVRTDDPEAAVERHLGDVAVQLLVRPLD